MTLKLSVGERVRLRRDVERFPHFVAPAGALGTVTVIDRSPPALWVRMDDSLGSHVEGNEIAWYEDTLDDAPLDLESVGVA